MKQNFNSLLFVIGLSGAGKSTANDILSDIGYYSIDNLPVGLLKPFLELARSSQDRFHNTSLLLDVENKAQTEVLLALMKDVLPSLVENFKVLFLDCSTETIIKRYSETRRPHPEFNGKVDKSLTETVQRERNRLQPIKELAHHIVDTSHTSPHDLKRELQSLLEPLVGQDARTLHLNFVSFGFKNGLPRDCDLVVDVRFLRNPHYQEDLRHKTGLDKEVEEYVCSQPQAEEFVVRYSELLQYLVPLYAYEGKSYLNIGVGCTGGMHRSVCIAEILAKKISIPNVRVTTQHRDITIRR